jgi:hypothetical protein
MSIKGHVIQANQAAANALGISLWPAEITTPDQIESVFSKIAQDRADAVVREGGGCCSMSGRVLAQRSWHTACRE